MKRLPPYVVVALCGLLFISAGLIGMFADSTEPPPADPAVQTVLPTATLTLTPIPVEVIAPVVQPPVEQAPVVVVAPPTTEVQPIPTQVVVEVTPFVPTVDPATIPTVAPLPTEVAPVESVPAEVVPTEVLPTAVLPTEVIPTESLPTESVPVENPPVEETPVNQDTRDVPGAPVEAPLPTRVGPVDTAPIPTVEIPATAVTVPVQPTVDPAIVPTFDPAIVPTVDPAIIPTVDSATLPTADPATIPTVDPAIPTVEIIVPTAVPTDAAVPVLVGQISGIVTFQEAQDHTGILVLLTLPDGTQLQNTTGAPGTFEFLNLKPGTYRVEAGAQGYLSRQIEFTLAEGETVQLPSTFLVAGDTNFDNIIDVNDAALVASNFDGPATVQTADPNRDGWVDVRDLALIGADFGLTGPIPWQ